MNTKKQLLLPLLIFLFFFPSTLSACSILYYKDPQTGKIYVANHEDYWYDTKAYIRINPASGQKLARMWYGWDNFAQGGMNSAGLFFDGAVTPEQNIPEGYGKPKGNLGDEILATCCTVEEALSLLEDKKIALSNAHMMLGDKNGNAVVVEWIDGEKKLHWISGNKLLVTNYLLAAPEQGNYPCPRFQSIENRIAEMEQQPEEINLLKVGNTLGQAAQPPQADEAGRVGGTLYSTFINLSDMEFYLIYKLDNSKVTKLDLLAEFKKNKKQKIKLG